jgi:hypothetical protein
MPYGEPDLTDPTVLVGVELPSGPEALEAMAYVFAEEFARLGFDEARLLRLFRSPLYAAPHCAFRALGEARVRAIVAECVRAWAPHTRTSVCGPSKGEDSGA